MTETTPPPEDELPDTSGGELLPPAGPDEVRPQDPTEEGLPEDEQGGDQTDEEVQRGGSSDDSGARARSPTNAPWLGPSPNLADLHVLQKGVAPAVESVVRTPTEGRNSVVETIKPEGDRVPDPNQPDEVPPRTPDEEGPEQPNPTPQPSGGQEAPGA